MTEIDICQSCLTENSSSLYKVEDKIKIIFSDLIQKFELQDGFLCDSCHQHLNNFSHFKIEIIKNHETLANKSSELVKRETIIEPEIVIKTEIEDLNPGLFNESLTTPFSDPLNSTTLLKSNKECSKKSDQKLSCSICGFTSVYKQVFSRHKQSHKKSQLRLPCDRCSLKFTDKNSLILHQNREHPDRGEFTCVNCYSIFTTLDLMRQHQRYLKCYNQELRRVQKKSNERLLCTLCGKMILKTQLRVHVSVIHNKERNHQCAACGKSYANATGLRHHRLSQHSNGKQFECAHCAQKFTTKYTLQRHLNHTHFRKGMKFRCERCMKGFLRLYALDRHMKQAHSPDEQDDELKVNVTTNNFHCPQCDNQFIRKLSCQQHILKFHK